MYYLPISPKSNWYRNTQVILRGVLVMLDRHRIEVGPKLTGGVCEGGSLHGCGPVGRNGPDNRLAVAVV